MVILMASAGELHLWNNPVWTLRLLVKAIDLSLYLSFEPGIKLFGARIGGRKEKEESMDEEKANEWEIVASFIWRKKRMNE